jgi:fructose-1,6-bisphosphatase/inositol monophosphatase family enzyme
MKIFGIGLSKTGTTSLAQALTLLGFKTQDNPGLSQYSPGGLSSIDAALLEEFDALTDTPIPSFYRELDAKFRDAKFILTLRERQGWLNSCKKQFTQKLADKQNEAHNKLFLDLYGCTVFDEAKFAAGYDRFVLSVQDHFKDRPGKLLTLNVTGGDGWEQLCPFLDRSIPDAPFPKANVTRIRWTKVDELVAAAKEAGEALTRTHTLLLADRAPVRGGSRLSALGDWFVRTYLELRGGREHAVEQAARAANQILVSRLTRLNPDIPIISRLSPAPAHLERGKWNHFWLIDPLDGADGFATSAGDFSVNIALIEDQKPIYGVVHAPVSGTTYFATAGKPAFKATATGAPMELDGTQSGPVLAPGPEPASKALTICLIAEGAAQINLMLADTMEWHSAAAHVVAGACGKHIRPCREQDELKYNKPSLAQDCIAIA